jgi:hypothetical protein
LNLHPQTCIFLIHLQQFVFPVANELVGDPGLHCFNVPWFNRCFPHKIKLSFIHRKSDTTLIKCINAFVGYFTGYLVNGNRAMIEINIFSETTHFQT